MLKRLEVFLIAAIFILITAVILIIYSTQREKEFQQNTSAIEQATINGAAYAINLKLLEKHRHVQLFANEYGRLLVQLNNNPNNEKIENDIKTRLQQRFSDFFTFTITDSNGRPRLVNIDSLVGHACEMDLSNYAKKISSSKNNYQNTVFIHPQPFNYHYDIMSPLITGAPNPSVFFVSFYPKEVSDILKTHALPGQQLFLVKQSDPALIEISQTGARDKLKREIRLSRNEQRNIHTFKNIPGTDWRLVNVSDKKYADAYKKGLWKEAIIIMVIVTIALFLIMFVLIKGRSK